MSGDAIPAVEMKGITKKFPGVVANDGIDLRVYSSQVHSLLGENGAGKTTLMNILYGLYSADSGEIWVRGKLASIRSPKDAIALGIAMVHQHFELVPTLTVAENVGLGLKVRREPLLELSTVSSRILGLSKEYGLRVDPHVRVDQLSVGERQRVEIIKALYRNARILILDEPTSILTPGEAEELFGLLRSMNREGRSVVFITHKLPEVMAVSDRVTVMRHGKVAANLITTQTNPRELAEKMVGREVELTNIARSENIGEELLKVEAVSARNDKGAEGLKGVSLELKAGEILGIAGVAGNGQRELAEVLTGMRKVTGGGVTLVGEGVTNKSPRELIERGVGYIPEDRRETGLIMQFTLAENLILEVRDRTPFSRGFASKGPGQMLDQKAIREHAVELVKEYDISTPSVDMPTYTLSGGNLQKLILAKVLSRSPRVLVADQPTAGLDVGATEFIWGKLKGERRKGVGIILISGDLGEVMSLSDRIAVMYGGKIEGTVQAGDADIGRLGLMMGGAS